MSRFLSNLLSEEKALIEHSLGHLEGATGEPNIDIHLSSEIITRTQLKIRQLGLDPKDTTPTEIYQALLNLVSLHDEFLSKQLKIDSNDSSDEAVSKIKEAALKMFGRKTVWAMRHNVAKRLLSAMPPRELMRGLGYRSSESMLKREPINDLMAGIRICQSQAWQDQFFRSYSALKPSDFESKPISISQLNSKRWQTVSENFFESAHHTLVRVDELGSIVILPLGDKVFNGLTITLLPLLLHYLGEVRSYSSFVKLHQVQADFGETIANSMIDRSGHSINLAGQPVNWNIIHKFFGVNQELSSTDLFGPQVQAEDLTHVPYEQALYKLEPALHFWSDSSYLGLAVDNQLVSLNLLDNAINYLNGLSIESSSNTYLASSLWQELISGYLKYSAMQDQLAQQFDTGATGDEIITDVDGEVFA